MYLLKCVIRCKDKHPSFAVFFLPFFLVNDCIGQDLRHPEAYSAMYDIAFQHPYPKRWNMIDSIRSNSFTHLKSKEGYLFRVAVAELAAKQHKDDKAVLIVQLAKMDYLQRSSKVELRTFQEWYRSSLETADKLDFVEIKSALTFLYAVNLSQNYQQDVQSLYFLNKAIDYSSALREGMSTQKGLLLSGVTRIFYQFDDFVSAVKYGKEVEKYDINPVEKFLTLDIVGVSYLKLKNYDSALIYVDKSLQMFHRDFANEDDKKVWYGILTGNKAHVLKGLGDLTRAIQHYKIGIEETIKHNLLDNTCRFAIGLADLYLSQNNAAEASKLIPLAQRATYSQGTDSDHLQLHQLLSKYYKEVGNMSLVVLHKDSTQYWTEVLEKRRGKNVQIQADLKLETERRQHAETTLEENIHQQKLNRIITIVIILLVTGLAFVGILRQRLLMKVREKELKIKQQEAEKLLLLEQEKAKREQMLAQLKLEEFTNIIVAKNKQIEMLEAENERGSNDGSIRQLQHNSLLTEDQWANFKLLFEKVHTGYLQRLKEKIPSISPAEIRFMALAKLKLDSKEMASSLGVSPNAVRNVWFRLRKKIDLPEEVTWNDFADTI